MVIHVEKSLYPKIKKDIGYNPKNQGPESRFCSGPSYMGPIGPLNSGTSASPPIFTNAGLPTLGIIGPSYA